MPLIIRQTLSITVSIPVPWTTILIFIFIFGLICTVKCKSDWAFVCFLQLFLLHLIPAGSSVTDERICNICSTAEDFWQMFGKERIGNRGMSG